MQTEPKPVTKDDFVLAMNNYRKPSDWAKYYIKQIKTSNDQLRHATDNNNIALIVSESAKIAEFAEMLGKILSLK